MTEDLKLPELPPLPEPAGAIDVDEGPAAPEYPDGARVESTADGYTADQMRDYARAVVLAERERCALLCDDHAAKHRSFASGSYSQGRMYAAEDLAAAIRGHAEEKQ
jgi:hypothetical protein